LKVAIQTISANIPTCAAGNPNSLSPKIRVTSITSTTAIITPSAERDIAGRAASNFVIQCRSTIVS
jgi:hypothetical protein